MEDPAGQAYPAMQRPAQEELVLPAEVPNRPAPQLEHSAKPDKENVPGWHSPEHSLDVSPSLAPYLSSPNKANTTQARVGCLHTRQEGPAATRYNHKQEQKMQQLGLQGWTGTCLPGGQLLHDAALALAGRYCPEEHSVPLELKAPAPQNLPADATHNPEQAGDARPATLPNTPTGQVTHTHAPGRLYWPMGHTMHAAEAVEGAMEPPAQGVHDVALTAGEKRPLGHVVPVGDVVPAPQKYPGTEAQAPLQAGDDAPTLVL